MTRKVATVKQIFLNLKSKTQANSILTVLSDKPYWAVYNNHHEEIDKLLVQRYSAFVMPDVSNPDEVNYPGEDIIFSELTLLSNQALTILTSNLDRLWSLESVEFSPIENYDRYEQYESTRTGGENETETQNGSERSVNTPTGSDVTNTELSGTVMEQNGGTRTNSQDTSNTSYNTNEVTNVTDTTKDTTSHTTTYDGATTKVEYEAGVVNTNVRTVDNMITVRAKEFDNVKDVQVNHIHGNIGVTTATQMMAEFVSFYDTYTFWCKFWDMYITLFASPIFETDRSYYN